MAAFGVAGRLPRVLAYCGYIHTHSLRGHERRRLLDELRWRCNVAISPAVKPLEQHGADNRRGSRGDDIRGDELRWRAGFPRPRRNVDRSQCRSGKCR